MNPFLPENPPRQYGDCKECGEPEPCEKCREYPLFEKHMGHLRREFNEIFDEDENNECISTPRLEKP